MMKETKFSTCIIILKKKNVKMQILVRIKNLHTHIMKCIPHSLFLKKVFDLSKKKKLYGLAFNIEDDVPKQNKKKHDKS